MSDSEVLGEVRVSPMPRGTRWLVVYQVGEHAVLSDKIDLFSDKARRRFVQAALGNAAHPLFDAMLERLQEEAGKQSKRTIDAQERVTKKTEEKEAEIKARLAEAKAAAAAAGEDPPDETEFLDELDKVDEGSSGSGVRGQLVDLVLSEPGMEVFFDSIGADATAYVTLVKDNRRFTWPVKSAEFRRWLLRAFKKRYRDVPSSTDLNDGLHAIAAIPDEDAPTQEVFVRLAEHEGETWLDLADVQGRAVRINSKDWSIVDGSEVPVRFLHKQGMLALPEPKRGGRIELLREFLVKEKDDSTFVLLVAYLSSALRPRGPYFILVVNGQQGSAKSTTCKLVRALIDPHKVPLRRPVKDERNLMIAAQNNCIVGFDNVSVLSPELSDALCSLATGAGFGARKLFTDDEEKLIGVARPIILNGIGDVVTRGDALDRSLILSLRRIQPNERKAEKKFWARFDDCSPELLGALLDGHVSALRDSDKIHFDELPRMADQAVWLAAAESGLHLEPGTFQRALAANASRAQISAIDASPIGGGVVQLMRGKDRWEGTLTDLLLELKSRADATTAASGFPSNVWQLRQQLMRLNPSLIAEALVITFNTRSSTVERTRLVVIERVGKTSSTSSSSSNPPAPDAAEAGSAGRPLDEVGQGHVESVQPGSASTGSSGPRLDKVDELDEVPPTTSIGGDEEGEWKL